MKESALENLPNFYEFIPLNQKLTIDEAIQKLVCYHNSNRENILKAFINLRDFTEGFIEFKEYKNSGHMSILMRGKDLQGNRVWGVFIDKYSGQPETRSS